MCITDNNYLNIIDKLSYKLWRFAAQNKSISNQQDNTASCITTTTWTPNKIIIVLLLVYSRLTTKQICDERDHTYNIKHINDWWGQTATSCPAPLHLSYLLMEVVEITVAVLHGPLVLSICHLDDVDLKKKDHQGLLPGCVSKLKLRMRLISCFAVLSMMMWGTRVFLKCPLLMLISCG